MPLQRMTNSDRRGLSNAAGFFLYWLWQPQETHEIRPFDYSTQPFINNSLIIRQPFSIRQPSIKHCRILKQLVILLKILPHMISSEFCFLAPSPPTIHSRAKRSEAPGYFQSLNQAVIRFRPSSTQIIWLKQGLCCENGFSLIIPGLPGIFFQSSHVEPLGSHQDVIEKFGLRDVRTKAIEAKLSTLSQAGGFYRRDQKGYPIPFNTPRVECEKWGLPGNMKYIYICKYHHIQNPGNTLTSLWGIVLLQFWTSW